MIQIHLSNNIKIVQSALLRGVLNFIQKDLTLDNPSYIAAERYGHNTHGIERYIELYAIEGENLVIPRGYVFRLARIMKEAGLEYQVVDNRLILPHVDFHSKIKLRPYQVPAARALYKYGNGGLVGGCGSGKTEVLLAVMAAFRQKALWLTHTLDLANQVIDRAVSCFEGMTKEEIGTIFDGKLTVGERLTVSLTQTLSKVDLDPLLGQFGAVFVDEAHHLPAQSFQVPISKFPARYRLWCSATPSREDGLTKMVTAFGGPILFTIDQEALPTLKPRLVIVETPYTGYVNADNYPGMLSELTRDPERNRFIVDTISRETPGHFSLVLSERIEHLTLLKTMLQEALPEMRIEALTGDLPKKQRQDIVARARIREVDILLATQLAREGLDLPHLDRLFLVTPKRAAGAIQQEIGRIMRPCDNKQDAVIFDFWDVGNPVFKAQFWKRRAVYQNLGIDVDFRDGMQCIQEMKE